MLHLPIGITRHLTPVKQIAVPCSLPLAPIIIQPCLIELVVQAREVSRGQDMDNTIGCLTDGGIAQRGMNRTCLMGQAVSFSDLPLGVLK